MRWYQPALTFSTLSLGIAASLLAGCSQTQLASPSVEITALPPASVGGPEQMEVISGKVRGARPGQQIVLYARGGLWWVQPFRSRPYTAIGSDGTWTGSTHTGTEYAALLVDSDFRPQSRLEVLPEPGSGVVARVVVKGAPAPQTAQKILHFSGYDWTARTAASERGGELNLYSPENARVDSQGFLHLRMGVVNGHWSCAEVSLTRSLGYGTYRFLVQDSAHLVPSAVVGLFTLDERKGEDVRVELDTELSRWGRADAKNAQYVVQPYYVPQNIARFEIPPGQAIHVLRWEPGLASFKSYRGSVVNTGKPVAEHTFTSGIPAAAAETVHINLYDFYHSKSDNQAPSEVVIERFEYLP